MTGKDIYDVHFGLELELSEDGCVDILDRRIEHEGIHEFFPMILRKLDNTVSQSTTIRDATNHYVPKDLRPDWEELVMSLRSKIARMFE